MNTAGTKPLGFVVKGVLPSLSEVYSSIISDRKLSQIVCSEYPSFKWLPDYDEKVVEELERAKRITSENYFAWDASILICALPRMNVQSTMVFFLETVRSASDLIFSTMAWDLVYHCYDGYEVELFSAVPEICARIEKNYNVVRTDFPGRIQLDG
jgi:hypothetical protein